MTLHKARHGREKDSVERPELMNGATLAYIGDAVYEVAVRQHVLLSGETHPNQLHRLAIRFVEAAGQAQVMKHWLSDDTSLTPEEIQIYKRGRNYKTNTKAKNASIGDYRQATGFEALIGWLYLSNQHDRMNQLMQEAIQWIESTHSQ